MACSSFASRAVKDGFNARPSIENSRALTAANQRADRKGVAKYACGDQFAWLSGKIDGGVALEIVHIFDGDFYGCDVLDQSGNTTGEWLELPGTELARLVYLDGPSSVRRAGLHVVMLTKHS